jgi:hypothetical protein
MKSGGAALHNQFFAAPALAPLGRSGTLAKIARLQLVLTIALWLATAPFGLLAIAGACVLRSYLVLPIQMPSLRLHCGLGYRAMMGAIAGSPVAVPTSWS